MNLPQSNYSPNKSQIFDPSNQIDLSNYPKSKRIKRKLNHKLQNNVIIKNKQTLIINRMTTIITFLQEQIKLPYNLRQQPKKDYRVFIPESKIS